MKKGFVFSSVVFTFLIVSCKQQAVTDISSIKQLEPAVAVRMSDSIGSVLKPQLADGLTIKLWGVDSLVISPIAIDIDDQGRLYYTKTNRQVNSEFDIRAHRDWEIRSISLQTVEDRRNFLHTELSPENSYRNKWLKDVNGDSSRDWRDLTVEKENVFRLEDLNGDGVADKSQRVVDDFHDEVTDVAGGVLSDGDDLYVAVAPDLWRMKDKNGDGIADEKTSLSHGYGVHIGFSGHGMSGVEMGPDGKIYWQIGDIGFNGKSADGQKWEYPNSGVIARSNPDGSDFEVFAAGLRNTHEFAFDEFGNLISEDNDGDHAGEKERLVYITNGSDAGWRSNWQYGKYNDPDNNTYKVWMDEKMYLPRYEGQAAYITPCISNYVSGPAGFVYNPGTALGPQYKNHFFVAEFVGSPAGSAIHSFTLKPKGATFELGDTKKIVSGILTTGMDFGPDGALYAADWIDGWATGKFGRIWKLDDKAGAAMPERKLTKDLLAADFKGYSKEQLGELLGNADMRVRLKAQFELVKRGTQSMPVLQQWLAQKNNQLARIHGIWGISQLARKEKDQATVLLPYLKDQDPEIRAQVAKWLGDIRYKAAGESLLPLLNDSYSRARFFAAEALGRISYEPAIQPIIDMLRANRDEDAYLRHAGSLALSRIGKADPIIALSKDTSRAVRIAAVVALRRMSHPSIANFLADADEFVVTETARAINDDNSIPAALPALGGLLNTTHFTNEALIRRVINANMRVGTEDALQALVDYAAKDGNPVNMRLEAISTLSTWAKPSVLDRVDGRLRGAVTRDAAPVKAKAGPVLMKLLASKDGQIRLGAAKAISKLQISGSEKLLLGLLKTDPQPAVRKEALEALANLQYDQIGMAIKQALSDKEKIVRVAGIDLLGRSKVPADLMVSLLANVINTKSTEEKQSALLTLGKLPLDQSKKVLEEQLDKMEKKKLSPDVLIELSEAIDSSRSAELASKLKEVSKTLATDTLTAAFAGSLYGGNPEKGRDLFFGGEAAQCIRCHSYDDYGGNAGPRLNGIASRLTRPQLLEALINPSARLSPGFGMVTVTTKDGKTISGILQEETKTQLMVKSGSDAPLAISKDQVGKRINAKSSMPEMRFILNKKEIRDVVSFLATLKDTK
ncbi:HEAT repeat domain-containing protein [Flavihumibacter profundi]|uniref:HEAT repeat domain-containing protein n=1 Tax=Flavihumibacter profundi TaxID=2716883 RepID=UPI001CC5DC7E|nr:HEAT repeat domain-containing protein [Flavihumibacter profundi]MBZ5858319.1 HEAT repeat domain-containing protein [Flavihumibacter profundi]